MKIINEVFVKHDPAMQVLLDEERGNAEIARRIYHIRAKAGLTQAALAKKIGTTASVISRLEDADYEGHSLGMLQRIATALGMTIKISFVPARRGRAA